MVRVLPIPPMEENIMKKMIIIFTVLALSFGFTNAGAEEKKKKAQLEELMALTNEAAAFLSEKGKDGLPELNQKDGRWVRGEL